MTALISLLGRVVLIGIAVARSNNRSAGLLAFNSSIAILINGLGAQALGVGAV